MRKLSTLSILILMSLVGIAEAAQTTWTGLYSGVDAGFVFNHTQLRSHQLGFTDPNGTCNANSNYSSFFPGVQVGYANQVYGNIVLGVEGNVTYHTNQTTNFRCDCPVSEDFSDRFSFKNRMQGLLAGRIGYALSPAAQQLLPFLMAGVSVANLKLNYHDEANDHYAKNAMQAGWLIGAGIEWAFMNKWSLRAEYVYVDYGKAISMRIPVLYGLYDPNGYAHVNLTANYVELALNYWI